MRLLGNTPMISQGTSVLFYFFISCPFYSEIPLKILEWNNLSIAKLIFKNILNLKFETKDQNLCFPHISIASKRREGTDKI